MPRERRGGLYAGAVGDTVRVVGCATWMAVSGAGEAACGSEADAAAGATPLLGIPRPLPSATAAATVDILLSHSFPCQHLHRTHTS